MESRLVVDESNCFWRNAFTHQGLSYKGNPTGATFGVLEDVIGKIDRVQAAHVIVCKDTGPYHRKADCALYKADRKERDPEMQQMQDFNQPHLRQALELAGIPQWSIKGVEADDLMYVYAREMKRRGKVYLLCNDSDMYSAFEGTAKVFLIKKNGFYGLKHFREEFPDVDIKDWQRITSLAGSHNGHKGCKGVGAVTARKAVKDKALYAKLYEKHGKTIDAGLAMAHMPYTGDREVDFTIPTRVPEYREEELEDYLWENLHIKLTYFHKSVLQRLAERMSK